MKPFKNKKAMTWEEIAIWIIVGVLLIIIILAIIAPVRRFFFSKAAELFSALRFGM